MLVAEIMNPNTVSVSPEESVSLAAKLLSRHNVGALPVCSGDGKIRGMITDRDIVIRCIAADNDPSSVKIDSIMSHNVTTVSPEDDISRASDLMAKEQVRRLPVSENGRLVGIISLGDLASYPASDMEAARALSEISVNISRR